MKCSHRAIFVVLVIFFVGCFRSPPTRFYSLLSESQANSGTQLLSDGVQLEVFSIIFPKYLEDPRMAIRTGLNEITRDEYERWIESLRINFRDALLRDLSEDLKSANIFSSDTYSQRRGNRVLQVEVLQFDVTDEGRALLKARWALGANRDVIAHAPLTVSEFYGTSEGNSSEAHVAALSKLVIDFSRVVAQGVLLK